MTTIFRCPHCPQTSERRWNLKNHINNKHDGMGEPIKESSYSGKKYSTYTNVGKGDELLIAKSFRDKQRGLKPKPDKFQPKHFLQDYLDWARPLLEFKRIMKELSGFSLQSPVAQPSFLVHGFATGLIPQENLNFKPILGYKVYTCDRCLSNILFPVYFYDENRELFEKRYNCHPIDYNSYYNTLDRMGILKRLNDESPNFLDILISKSIITPRFDRLIAIPTSNPTCPTALYSLQEKPLELQLIDNKNYNHLHWANRAILSGVITLDERELSEYLHLVRDSTFAFFKVIEKRIEVYFMALSNLWQSASPH